MNDELKNKITENFRFNIRESGHSNGIHIHNMDSVNNFILESDPECEKLSARDKELLKIRNTNVQEQLQKELTMINKRMEEIVQGIVDEPTDEKQQEVEKSVKRIEKGPKAFVYKKDGKFYLKEPT